MFNFVCLCVELGRIVHECSCLWRPEENIESCGLGFTRSWELPDLGGGNNSGPLQEQHVLLTVEQSPEPNFLMLYMTFPLRSPYH